MRKEIRWVALAALIASSLHASAAPTWKKGMAIPVVTEGSACNSATDKIAVTSTNLIVSCQSGGVWKKATSSGTVAYWPEEGGASCPVTNVSDGWWYVRVPALPSGQMYVYDPGNVGCNAKSIRTYHCVNGTVKEVMAIPIPAPC